MRAVDNVFSDSTDYQPAVRPTMAMVGMILGGSRRQTTGDPIYIKLLIDITAVLGPTSAASLGRTLTHEHVSMTFTCTYIKEPVRISHKINITDLNFDICNLSWIRQYPYSCRSNLHLNECQSQIIDEIHFFKKCGGRTIVENTTQGIDPDVKFLYELSKSTGVNIVSGAGYYVACAQPTSNVSLTTEEMSKFIRDQLTVGEAVNTSDGEQVIKRGCIGEVGCAWPLHEFERRSLQASAIVQSELNCPVIIHPGRSYKSPFEIMRVFQEAGGKADKTIMSHLDRTFEDLETLCEFASIGCYNEYDLFGIETSFYSANPKVMMPSDGERIKRIQYLIDEGYEDKITISHDIHTKHRLMSHGGHGFSHILVNVTHQMSEFGMSEALIDKILVKNPVEWLTYNCS